MMKDFDKITIMTYKKTNKVRAVQAIYISATALVLLLEEGWEKGYLGFEEMTTFLGL